MVRQEPISRRDRPSKPALSRAAIVDAALAVIERDGADKLTMRKLAAALDTGPASLYVYVKNTTELYALLIDRLVAELDLGWDGKEAWRPRLYRVLDDYTALLTKHREFARAAQIVWPDGPHYLDLIELLLRLLTAAGVTRRTAAMAVDLLLQFATSSAVERAARFDEDGQDLDDLIETLESADPDRHPTVADFGSAVFVEGDPLDRRRWAFDVLVAGILARE
ncbi:TetR/AcrR family transcriptional regulator [Plantibacter sp. Mn2098]|uniref:TetR/AcrR family transcriptional regulator n=1 Tax=Plantibacter sp. Mn2098 TaxID=3395266 RepID=UPI003BDB648A